MGLGFWIRKLSRLVESARLRQCGIHGIPVGVTCLNLRKHHNDGGYTSSMLCNCVAHWRAKGCALALPETFYWG